MRRVDIHSHLFPDAVFARLPKGLIAERFPARDQVGVRAVDGPSAGRGAPIAVRDVAAHRRVREAHRVDVAILSAWNKLTAVTEDPDLEAELCRVVNQELAAATQAGPDAYLASLPVGDGARAADELSRAIGEGAVGGLLTANPHRGLLDRADLAHLWRTAEALGAPLLVHPSYFVAPPRLRDGEFSNAVGYPFETTLAAASLLAAGVPDRFPDLRLILVHGGGFLPYQYGRVVTGLIRHGGRRLPRAGLDYVRWFYFDTAQLKGPALRYLLDLVGPSRVLAGTDCPLAMCDFSIIDDPAQFGLGPEESAQVLGGNADRLFQLDRSTSARTAS